MSSSPRVRIAMSTGYSLMPNVNQLVGQLAGQKLVWIIRVWPWALASIGDAKSMIEFFTFVSFWCQHIVHCHSSRDTTGATLDLIRDTTEMFDTATEQIRNQCEPEQSSFFHPKRVTNWLVKYETNLTALSLNCKMWGFCLMMFQI